MFKQLTTVMVLMAFVSQTFRGPFILVDYFTNTAVFAKNCINKSHPKMHCNGKCQMMKQLQEEEKKEQQDAANKLEIKIAVLPSTSLCNTSATYFITLDKINTSHINNPVTSISLDIFHPPQV